MESIASTWRIAKKGFVLTSGALTIALALSGCGTERTQGTESAVSGVVAVAPPASGTVRLRDSSVPSRELTATIDAEGRFTFDVSGLTPPFIVVADASDRNGTHRMCSVGDDDDHAIDVNAFTDAAYRGWRSDGSCDDDDAFDDDGESDDGDDDGDDDGHHARSRRFHASVAALQAALKPLLDLYGVPADPLASDAGRAAVRAMLSDVRFDVEAGTLVVTNRETGGVIFSGPLREPASGTFHAENLPGGPGTAPDDNGTPPPPPPPPSGPTACTYNYSAWGACEGGTQTRTVASSSPAGCTGTPLLTQACTAAPAIDGAALYAARCSGCHGSLATSSVRGRTAAQITAAGMTRGLTPAEVAAVATALQ